MSYTDGATKKSLFIQVAWFDAGKLAAQLEHVRLHHKDRSRDDYIYNCVLSEIGTPYGLYTAYGSFSTNLDIISHYLPGGARKCFDNVFVGSTFIKWAGPGSHYREGMANADHRWANLKAQKKLWSDFALRYPQIPIHFYIEHEGVLDYFDIPEVRAGDEAYLIQSVRDAHYISPNRALLWSPAVWSGVPLTPQEEDAIGTTFRNVEDAAKRYGHYGGVKWLHLQDMMGRGRPDIDQWDVKQWYEELKGVYDWDSLRINMELFNVTNWTEQRREDWYQRQGIPVGASFELRYWYDTHKDLE